MRTVEDLVVYWQLFETSETPGKARLLNCGAGWECQGINLKKVWTYDLQDYVQPVHPGSAAALVTAIESAFEAREPVLFFYWGPTTLTHKLDTEFGGYYRLAEPLYSEACWLNLACAYPDDEVLVTMHPDLAVAAPDLVDLFGRWEFNAANQIPAQLRLGELGGDLQATAEWYLWNTDDWKAWVGPGVVERVRAALERGTALTPTVTPARLPIPTPTLAPAAGSKPTPTPTATPVPQPTPTPTPTPTAVPAPTPTLAAAGSFEFELGPESSRLSQNSTISRNPSIVFGYLGSDTMTIVAATLDSVDVTAVVNGRGPNSFALDTNGLALGSHTITVYWVRDLEGGLLEDTFTFAVVVHPNDVVQIPLSPGWNLISLPRWPIDGSLGALLSGTNADRVVTVSRQGDPERPFGRPPPIPLSVCTPPGFSYDEVCVEATSGSDGTWSGPLTHLGADRAYWVHSTGFAPIRVALAPAEPVATMPGTQVSGGLVSGNNFVGIVPSGFSDNIGATIGLGLDADLAFGDLEWAVAYAFNTSQNAWIGLAPGKSDRVFVGKGYVVILK